MKIIIFYLLLLIPSAFYAQEIQKIRIDPSLAYGGRVSDYFETVEFIPLETTKESLFGDRDQMIVTDSSFVISDFDTKSILFFTLKGKFLGKKSFPKNKYLNIQEDILSKKIILRIYDPEAYKAEAEHYSFTGRLLAKTSIKMKDFLGTTAWVPLGNDYYAVGRNCYIEPGKKPRDSAFNLIEIYHRDVLYNSFLPVNQLKKMGLCRINGFIDISKRTQQGSVFAATPLEHVIYKINKDSATPIYKMLFPADRAVSDSILYSVNLKRIDSTIKKLQDDPNLITNLSNIFFHNNLLFFRINANVYFSTTSSESAAQYNFFYDTASRKLSSLERIKPDELSYFLPLSDFTTSMKGFEYDGDFVYSTVSALNMFAQRKATKERVSKLSSGLEKFFNMENRKSNLIIVKMKLKE
ncbi:6-bladed beta-propeller [Haoranjiania flava]|uniref:6-bladed beta-propeller n=1 Tax=Haoranjiania flava TaxID=1856322 RepID=A0AAE3INU7_9BACT|nr:6-bladed beta-propeller [Haoranjiania flava]MCU7693092.1 6-bladed beta-propeller [Haoranjiania flava]